jgi:gentisate 1,2-dioxygenase
MNAKLQSSREAFIEDLLANNFTTFFVATHPKYSRSNPAFRFTPTPVSAAVPWCWSWQDARARLMTLSGLLTPEEAERRNINFVNPALKDFMPAATLPTLRGGIQLLLPGEQAIAHRHSANAFRLVLEAPASGAYTTVQGYRLPMTRGDLILTPNWTWHDHHNESDAHVIWYDGLDVLIACWIGGVFYQEMVDVTGDRYQAIQSEANAVTAGFGSGLLHRRKVFPEHIPASDNSLVYYPYREARQRLEELAALGAGEPREGVLLDYVNPVSAGPAFPSMGLSLRLIRGKSAVEAMHRTENVVFITLEGSVTFRLPGNQSLVAGTNDVTAIPSWVPYSIVNDAKEPAVLFSQSDRPLFEALGFYREQEA